jgi:uncharacterized protein (UPF0210 family)
MKIRSVTYFDNPGYPLQEDFLIRSEKFQRETLTNFQDSGIKVQSIRFASTPYPTYLGDLSSGQIIEYACKLEAMLIDQGYAYLSLGPALPEIPASYSLIPELIEATEVTFCSGIMTPKNTELSLIAVRACGEIIHRLTPLDPQGFANLYFAALGNVPAGIPFFPASYHSGGPPAFAIAVEGADLAVDAFTSAASLENARQQLIKKMDQTGEKITEIGRRLEGETGAEYQGIDYSLAPFPDPSRSTGAAFEKLGINKFGEHGSLAAAAFLADTIDRGTFQRTGFSGLMLPVLEDAILAARAADGSLELKDLLMYSAVCGTGLDTVPLPGDISSNQISAVLLDVAALSLRLDKPLTARLMPIPGKKAGDPTEFDFEFFANSKVLAVESSGLGGVLSGEEILDLRPRPPSLTSPSNQPGLLP